MGERLSIDLDVFPFFDLSGILMIRLFKHSLRFSGTSELSDFP